MSPYKRHPYSRLTGMSKKTSFGKLLAGVLKIMGPDHLGFANEKPQC